MTNIEWVKNTDGSQGKTWNPIVGCSIVSPGCTNCYAMRMAARLDRMGMERYRGLTQPTKAGAVWTGEMRLVDEALALPLRTRKPTTWFVNSMSDLFAENVPDAWIDKVFAVMALAPHHTFQVLTKRSARMRAYLSDPDTPARVALLRVLADRKPGDVAPVYVQVHPPTELSRWPLKHVWLGVSTEDQRRADERVPDLLATPAAVRFVSAEPLLGPIDFRFLQPIDFSVEVDALNGTHGVIRPHGGTNNRLDWTIVGGESGPGARPMHPDWAREIRDQCAAAGVPFFHKQHGAWAPSVGQSAAAPFTHVDGLMMSRVGKKLAGRLLDGVEHNGMPEVRA